MFLNTSFRRYLLADGNPDLIDVYKRLLREQGRFIAACRRLFSEENNSADRYYAYRDEFNSSRSRRRRAELFVYLNRHCYNGLCRYNSKGQFNSPFGLYRRPYFPEREMQQFITAAGKAEFMHAGFDDSMARARRGDVVYCDPPYAPLSATACFTDYHTGGFRWPDQVRLADLAARLADRGVQVVVSNHDTADIRRLYQDAGAQLEFLQVRRNISCRADGRKPVAELLAVFGQGCAPAVHTC